MINQGLFTSATDEWATPQDFFDALNDEFHFTLDVCANEQNHKCERYFSKADDGLKMDWGGRDYMVQPTVWPRDQQVGGKVCCAQRFGSYAAACAHRYALVPRLHLQEVGDQVYQRTAQVWWEQELCSVSEYGCGVQKGRAMIHAISIHALERLHQRRQLKHFMPHIHKMQRWGMPDTGTFEHKGYRYITRKGVLITVLPPTHSWYRENKRKEVSDGQDNSMRVHTINDAETS